MKTKFNWGSLEDMYNVIEKEIFECEAWHEKNGSLYKNN